ncbi:MAG: hypothetical protein FJZ58_03165 [Chlamydiae bacterium]|nr:hypothetical protein [Chlamydiota bacterium]
MSIRSSDFASRATSLAGDLEERTQKDKPWLKADLANRIQEVYQEFKGKGTTLTPEEKAAVRTLIVSFKRLEYASTTVKPSTVGRCLSWLTSWLLGRVSQGAQLVNAMSTSLSEESRTPLTTAQVKEKLEEWGSKLSSDERVVVKDTPPGQEVAKRIIDFLHDEKVTFLDLSGCKDVGSLPREIFTHERFQKLDCLDLSETEISQLPPFVQECKNLESLILVRNPLGQSAFVHLASLPNLKVLNMRGCFVKTIPEAVLLMETLEELDLAGNQLGAGSLSNLQLLAQKGALKELWIGENKELKSKYPETIGNLDKEDASGHYGLHRPEPLTTDAVTTILKKWRIGGGENRKQTVKRILDFLHDEKVTFLDLSGCKDVGSLPRKIFTHEKFQKLDCLDLSETGISQLPPFVQECKNLESLILVRNPLGQSTFMHLASLPNLKTLNMRGCFVKTIPTTVLLMKTLEELDLAGNQLGAGSLSNLQLLAQKGVLKDLRITENKELNGKYPETIGELRYKNFKLGGENVPGHYNVDGPNRKN